MKGEVEWDEGEEEGANDGIGGGERERERDKRVVENHNWVARWYMYGDRWGGEEKQGGSGRMRME